jgi:predicted secreted hydrolase
MPDGADYGIQWTLFRNALDPEAARDGWADGQVWMGHAGLTTADRHLSAERFARGGIGQAGAREPSPSRPGSTTGGSRAAEDGDELDALRVTAGGEGFAYDLEVPVPPAPSSSRRGRASASSPPRARPPTTTASPTTAWRAP